MVCLFTADSWQIVEFGRYKRVAYLKLEEDEEVTSISPPGMEILDIGTNFYLGKKDFICINVVVNLWNCADINVHLY